jgi:hypothetical protein
MKKKYFYSLERASLMCNRLQYCSNVKIQVVGNVLGTKKTQDIQVLLRTIKMQVVGNVLGTINTHLIQVLLRAIKMQVVGNVLGTTKTQVI